MKEDLQIKYISVDKLKPYEKNAKIHTAAQIKKICKSIEECGFNDPIACDEKGVLIEGHGRLEAAKKLGWKKVPVIILRGMTEAQKKQYILVHNKLTMDTGFDLEILQEELSDLKSMDISLDDFGFEESIFEISENVVEDSPKKESPYTNVAPHFLYEPNGESIDISCCFNADKYKKMCKAIENSDASEKEKRFLKFAAARHIVFDFKNIANYYANASKEMQQLMEDSALVIIDVKDAIKKGYVKLSQEMEDMFLNED